MYAYGVLSFTVCCWWPSFLYAEQERRVQEHVMFPSGELTLEGLFWTPIPPPAVGVVRCHPHPLYGGDMYNNVVTALAEAFQQAGMMTLRFNFRGVGHSDGVHGGGDAEVDDVQAAVSYLLSRQSVSTVAVAGYSFGSMVGLRTGVRDARVHILMGVALPVGRRDASFLRTAQKPTLLVSGDRDDISPLPILQELTAQLPDPKKLVTIPAADHFFRGREREVAQAAVMFLQAQASSAR